MRVLVGVCSVLFLGAVGFLLLTFGSNATALLDTFWSLPTVQKIAWAAVAAVPFLLLAAAIWLSDKLVRQRRATSALQRRLGVAQGEIDVLGRAQADVDSSVNYLARTDPDDAVNGLQRRITEADRFTQAQQSRNDVGDLHNRIDDIRNRQQALKKRLHEVAEKRRSIEQLFIDLDRQQNDIESTLTDIEGVEGGKDLENHLRRLGEFIKGTHFRFEQIEHGLATLLQHKGELNALQARVAPLEAEQGGIRSLIRELDEHSNKLSANIDDLEKTPEGSLVERLKVLTERRQETAARVSGVNEQFAKLTAFRKEVGGLFANLGRALDGLSAIDGDATGSNLDARLREAGQFIERTEARFAEIERAMGTLGQMKKDLEGLQTRLVPLESEQTGVRHSIEEVRGTRDQLVARVERLEHDDESALVERVKLFAESKKELEARVSTLNEEFSKLAAIRKDIGALLAKLSGSISASLS